MGFLSLAVPVLAAALFILGETMGRHTFPRFDMLLAAGTAAPAATYKAAGLTGAGAPVSLFTAPLFHFQFGGLPVFLTIPDCLALLASAVMLVRFLAWAFAPVTRNRRPGGPADGA